jgi:hypothetical protein
VYAVAMRVAARPDPGCGPASAGRRINVTYAVSVCYIVQVWSR